MVRCCDKMVFCCARLMFSSITNKAIVQSASMTTPT
jgi:hypothetical protein